jgi:hypothetical protein
LSDKTDYNIKEGLFELSKILSKAEPEEQLGLSLSSFDAFIQNIFAQSYPQYSFDAWHIRKACQLVDKSKEEEKEFAFVFPRYHLKSTLMHGYTIYRMLTAEYSGFGLYLSYKDSLALMHTLMIKDAIKNNPLLNKIMIDMSKSESGLNYMVGGKKMKVYTGGMFGMKRGLHTDLFCILDDILADPANPLAFTELEKIERFFNAEIMNIPNKGCPMGVVGTVQDESDLLFKLRDNDKFNYLFLPAEHPDTVNHPDKEVLWEDQWPIERLKDQKEKIGSKAYASEFLLAPVRSTEAFIKPDELEPVINKDLKCYSISKPYPYKGENIVVAGVDIGKRRHPSHISIFEYRKNGDAPGKLVMLHQDFWDGMEYNDQVANIKRARETFGIDKIRIDNTRGEMDERNLPKRGVELVSMNPKAKYNKAFDFVRRIESETIELLHDDRFERQITCVANDLTAPDTPEGHGDSFESVSMAVNLFEETWGEKSGQTKEVANLQDTLAGTERPVSSDQKFAAPSTQKLDGRICLFCSIRGFVKVLEDGKHKCGACFTTW